MLEGASDEHGFTPSSSEVHAERRAFTSIPSRVCRVNESAAWRLRTPPRPSRAQIRLVRRTPMTVHAGFRCQVSGNSVFILWTLVRLPGRHGPVSAGNARSRVSCGDLQRKRLRADRPRSDPASQHDGASSKGNGRHSAHEDSLLLPSRHECHSCCIRSRGSSRSWRRS